MWRYGRVRPGFGRRHIITFATVFRRRSVCVAWPSSTDTTRSAAMKIFTNRQRTESGVALVTTLLLLVLMSSLMVGFFLLITSGQKVSGANSDYSRAFYGAQAGMEKLT